MVDFRKLTDRAKEIVEGRGGTEGLKKDASELVEIAKGKGSVGDKAKSAFERLKTPAHKREAPSDQKPASSSQQGGQEPSGDEAA